MNAQEGPAILERIYQLLSSLRGGSLIPTELVLSPGSYEKLISELINPAVKSSQVKSTYRLQLEYHFAVAVSIRAENTDLLIVKELVPNLCPICYQQLTFLRERIERFENDSRPLIRCPMGHRYPGQIKVYHINIQEEGDKMEKPVEICPECRSKNIHYFAPAEMFCLDCDWDSGLEPRYDIR